MSIIHFRAFLQRTLFAVITIACAIVIAATPAKSQKHIEDLNVFDLILQVKRGSLVLSEGVIALQQDDSYFLPVSEIARLVEFPVNIDLETNTIEGWFLKEENSYRIDLEQSVYSVVDRPAQSYSPGDVIIERRIGNLSEVYINVDLLNSIWPLNLDIDFSTMRMDVLTPLRLPYEARQDRQNMREVMLLNRAGDLIDVASLEQLDNPYKLFSKPIINLDTTQSYGDELSGKMTAGIQHDLLGFSASYRLNFGYTSEGEISTPETVRLRMRRQDYDGEPILFGLRRINFGDVSSTSNSVIASGQSGRGFDVSSRPTHNEVTFDEVTIRGEASPGLEIELYQNNQLIDFGFVPEDGEYKFENIILVSGKNVFRTVIYGFQGGKDERVETYNVARQIVEPGSFEYSFNLVDVGETLLPYDRREEQLGDLDGLAYSGSVQYGLRRWLSVFGSASQVVQNTGTDKYITAGANFNSLSGSGRVEFLKQIGGGQALDLRYVRSIAGWNSNLQSTVYNDFESQRAGEDNNAKKFEFRGIANRTYRLPFGTLGLRFSFDHERGASGFRFSRIDSAQTLNLSNLRLSNRTFTIFPNDSERQISGNLDTSYRLSRGWSVRSRLGYQLEPERTLEDFTSTLRYRSTDDFSTSLSLIRDLEERDTSLRLQLSKTFDEFIGSFDTDWNSESGFTFGLRANTTLAPYGLDGKYIASNRNLASNNALQARIFQDNDGDGAYSEGDERLDSGQIAVNGRGYDDTAKDGYITLINPEGNDYTAVQFNTYSAENPFLISNVPGYNVLLRPGTIQRVDFPLVESGAIDGFAFLEDGRPVSGLRLHLVNDSGEIVNTTLTAFDGFYTFEFVLPGEYIIRADEAQQVFVPPRSVSVTSDEIFVYGVDLVILDQAEEVLTSAITEAETGEVAQTRLNAQFAEEGMNMPDPSTIGGRPAFKSLAIEADDLSSELGEAARQGSPKRAEKGEVAHTKPDARTAVDAKSPASEKVRTLMGADNDLPSGEDTQTLKTDDTADEKADLRVETGEVAHTKPDARISGTDAVSSSLTSTSGKSATINQVRIGEYLGDMRIILDLSGPADYRISTEDDGEQIILFLPNTTWFREQNAWIFDEGSILLEVEGRTLDEGGSILRILARERVEINDVFVVRPTKRGDYELTIELTGQE